MEFSFDSWLDQGAIIGKVGRWVEVYWGPQKKFLDEAALPGPALFQSRFFVEGSGEWVVYAHSQRWTWREWKTVLASEIKKRPFTDTDVEWVEPNAASFKKIFQEIQREIKNKKIKKAVPVVTSKAAKTKPVWQPILLALKQSPINTYVYGQWSEGLGFLGFSPEILFLREKKNLVKTMALAGTRKKEHYLQDPEDFLRDPKELKEHQFVVDDIVARLQTFGKVKVSKTSFLELNYLTHLYTPIQVAVPTEFSFTQGVQTLHPTPALGVVPRTEMDLLKKWREGTELLGTPFGVRWGPNEYLCLVSIRKLQWDQSHYFISSGCGVVEESQFDEEWSELRLKRDSVKRTFQL